MPNITRARLCALPLVIAVMALTATRVSAAIVIKPPDFAGDPAEVHHTCPEPESHTCSDTLAKIEYLPQPSAGAMAAMGNDFPGWTFTANNDHASTGTLEIDSYAAKDFSNGDAHHSPGCISRGFEDGGMGGELVASYTPGANDGFHQFRWIQIIFTNVPVGGTTSPYVDPRPNNDNQPFYWRESDYNEDRAATDFTDESSRTCPCLGHTMWRGELYLTDWTGGNNVTVSEGIRWGYDIVCAVPEPTPLAAPIALLVCHRRCARPRPWNF